MKATTVILAIPLLVSAAHAQDAPTTSAEQRIAMQIGAMAMQIAQLGAQVEKDNQQITALQKQLAERKATSEQK